MVNRSSYKPHKIKNFKQNLKKDSKLQMAPKNLFQGPQNEACGMLFYIYLWFK